MRTCIMLHECNAIADLTPLGFDGKQYYINRINVPEHFRGKGFGSRLLDEICKDADHEKVILLLEINPSGRLDYDDLEEWYRRRGFTQPNKEAYFVRYPRSFGGENREKGL